MEMMVVKPVKVVVMAEEEAEREKKVAETGKKLIFLAYFGPDFLLLQAMKSTSIYRRWKRAILSTLRKTFSP